MVDPYRIITVSGNIVLTEAADGSAAIDAFIASGTGDYEIYMARPLDESASSWEIFV